MASIGNDANGRKRILFECPSTGKRKTLRLGKCDVKTAQSVRVHVEHLLTAATTGGAVPQTTAAWLASIPALLRQRLEAVGLVEPLRRTTLGEFLTEFIENRRPTVAVNTIINLQQAKRFLLKYFPADTDIASITAADAERWAAEMARRYAPATAGRAIRRARQFFKAALHNKLISENPFLHLRGTGQPNKQRQVHVPREVILRVINAAPDAEWRLLIALSRFGGLRCPTEHLALRWEDVNWERNRIRINSSKTGERWIPLFPELRPYLEECFALAEPGAEFVITRYRDTNANLRTQFCRIIRRAGETPWPKLFHNLRASRETELAAEYPLHVVCAWIGNSAPIAAKHYLTVRDSDFERASRGTKSGTPAAQKAAQQPDAGSCETANPEAQPLVSFASLPLDSRCHSLLRSDLLVQHGLEHSQFPSGNQWFSDERGTDSGTLGFRSANLADADPLLERLLAAWGRLPADDRLSLVEDAERLLEDFLDA